MTPLNVLPPSFGTRLIRTPLASLSAERPAVSIAISCTVASLVTMAMNWPPRPWPLLKFIPSISAACSFKRLPWIARPTAEKAVPPTSWLVLVTPGMSTPIWPVDFMPAGIAFRMSRVITFCWVTFCKSTVGDSPVTVIVSCSEPTRMSALTVAVKDAVSSTPSRLTVLKPVSVKDTV